MPLRRPIDKGIRACPTSSREKQCAHHQRGSDALSGSGEHAAYSSNCEAIPLAERPPTLWVGALSPTSRLASQSGRECLHAVRVRGDRPDETTSAVSCWAPKCAGESRSPCGQAGLPVAERTFRPPCDRRRFPPVQDAK